ncbi:hypothetical protein MNBD_NITROSPIRAE01-975 [hydrothermal vent metagenome]|uniref:Cytochrome c domain-containing protein n=1 Tax=hydrothermal vent metagenome TaxID=652676 RepID=A0A3B1D407_9ZZZZ
MKKKHILFMILCSGLMFGLLPTEASELEAGKAFFKKNRCMLCHSIGGSGGGIASDLSKIGNKRERAWFLNFFKNPKKWVPTAKMMPIKGSEKELSALADYLLAQK